MLLCRSQPAFEDVLALELAAHGWRELARGSGWVRAEPELASAGMTDGEGRMTNGGAPAVPGGVGVPELCFAQVVMREPVLIEGASVNQLAGALTDWFLGSMRGERVEAAWPCLVQAAAGLEGLGRRADGVEKAFREGLKKRLSRVAKLAVDEAPRGPGAARGLFVFFTDFGQAWVSRDVVFGGQRRMADDPQAPSRSYLKTEEAFVVLGREPAADETVVDLGAAPGGWSYSAAKRGARVVAIDNGPLKGGALNHPLIEHRMEDAFAYAPPGGERVDWLFCDLVEDPHHVMNNLIAPWLERGWCRRFVVNLKLGRVVPLAMLREVLAPKSVFVRETTLLRVRHLYHDREEITLVGEVRGD